MPLHRSTRSQAENDMQDALKRLSDDRSDLFESQEVFVANSREICVLLRQRGAPCKIQSIAFGYSPSYLYKYAGGGGSDLLHTTVSDRLVELAGSLVTPLVTDRAVALTELRQAVTRRSRNTAWHLLDAREKCAALANRSWNGQSVAMFIYRQEVAFAVPTAKFREWRHHGRFDDTIGETVRTVLLAAAV